MSSDANGNYSLPSSYFVQNGDTVLPVQHNPVFEDVAAALTARVMKDGRTTWTGNMKAGGFKITGLGDGENPQDAATNIQVNGSGTIASATTTDIGGEAERTLHITGSEDITSFGTAAAGVWRRLIFDDALSLTHNATSLILPDGVDITTAAGDTAVMVSEGSGNWRCESYNRAARRVNSERWRLISSEDASSSSAILFSLDTTNAGYDQFLIEAVDVIVGTSAATLNLRLGSNGTGGAFDSGSTDYAYAGFAITEDTSGGPFSANSTGASAFQIAGGALNTAPSDADIIIRGAGSASRATHVISSASYRGSTNSQIYDIQFKGRRTSSVVHNAVRIYPSAGVITSGTFRLYGRPIR